MIRTIAVPVLLAAACAGPVEAATLLVANKSDDTVDLIDLDSGRSVATLPTGHAPHEVAVSPDGKTAVVSNYGDREKPGSSLTVIDVERAAVIGTVDLRGHTRPHGLGWLDRRRVAATAEGTAHLLVVDPRAGRILREVETGQRVSHMVALARGARRAFVANIGSGNVSVIDLDAGKKLADVDTGDGAEGIAVTPDGREVWVSNRAAGTLSVLDAATLESKATLACDGFPIRVAVTPDGERVLVSLARSGEVALFDRAERRELKRAKLDLENAPDAAKRLFGDRFGESPVPVGLLVAPDGARVWIAATQADVVVVADPATLAVRDLLRAGREPDGMAFSPRRARPAPDAAPPAD